MDGEMASDPKFSNYQTSLNAVGQQSNFMSFIPLDRIQWRIFPILFTIGWERMASISFVIFVITIMYSMHRESTR